MAGAPPGPIAQINPGYCDQRFSGRLAALRPPPVPAADTQARQTVPPELLQGVLGGLLSDRRRRDRQSDQQQEWNRQQHPQ